MSDETEGELRRQVKAARASWRKALAKATSIGRQAALEAESSMGVPALRKVVDEAEKRIEALAAKGRPALPSDWKWDEDGRACCDHPSETVCLTDGEVEFMDHDKDKSMTRPAAVVRAVLAAEGADS